MGRSGLLNIWGSLYGGEVVECGLRGGFSIWGINERTKKLLDRETLLDQLVLRLRFSRFFILFVVLLRSIKVGGLINFLHQFRVSIAKSRQCHFELRNIFCWATRLGPIGGLIKARNYFRLEFFKSTIARNVRRIGANYHSEYQNNWLFA